MLRHTAKLANRALPTLARGLSTSVMPSVRFASNRINTHIDSVQYVSDLHLEHRKQLPILAVKSNTLMLAGDVGDPFKRNYRQFLRMCSDSFENTFLMSGNHEYWTKDQKTIRDVDEKIKDVVEGMTNVHFIKNRIMHAKNVSIAGCVLWSDIKRPPQRVRGDDKAIKDNDGPVMWDGITRMHKKDVTWLKRQIEKHKQPGKNKLMVLSHHLPTYDLITEFYRRKFPTVQDRFASDLDYLIEDPLIAWICGHSHCIQRMYKNDVYLGINSLGYVKESSPEAKCAVRVFHIDEEQK